MRPPAPVGLRALLASRFLGAVVEHGWKMLAAVLAIGVARGGVGTVDAAAEAFLVFIVPHTLGAVAGGPLADRLGMRRMLVVGKVLEVALALAAAAVVASGRGDPETLLMLLAWLGVRSGLLASVHEGLLPELLPRGGLSRGNGRLAAWTFAGVVLGTAAGAHLAADGAAAAAAAGAAVLAALGLGAAVRVPSRPGTAASLSFWRSLTGGLGDLFRDRPLRLAVVGLALFWFTAGLLGHNVAVYARLALDLAPAWRGLPLGALGIGVAIGSLLAGRWSRDEIEVGLVPLGAVALTALLALHALVSPGLTATLVLLFLAGASCGLLLVPLSAVVQWRAPIARRGSVIGLVAALSGLAVIAGLATAWWLLRHGANLRTVLLTASAVAAFGAVWGAWLFPASLVRALVIVLTRSVYRLTVVGRANVPDYGGVLLTPNHVSFADGLYVISAIDRPVRFLIHDAYFEHPVLSPFMRALGVIPVSSGRTPEEIRTALSHAGAALDRGEVVCVFPEGQITRTGSLHQFRRGMERIAQGRDAVIVPVALDRVWGSLLTRAGGRFFFRLPERWRRPITVMFGEPLPADTDANDVRDAVERLGARAWRHRRPDACPLGRSFVRTARRAPFRMLFADASRRRVSRIGALTSAIALARASRDAWRGQARVGCLLEPGVDAAVVQMAVALAGRTFVPLPPGHVAQAARDAAVTIVVTSGQAGSADSGVLPDGIATVDVETLPRTGAVSRLLAWLAPSDVVCKACGAERAVTIDDDAAIVFTGGRSGPPRGVRLTHFNLDANIEGLAQSIRPPGGARVAVTLPHWSAFGHVAVWFGAVHGLGVVLLGDAADADATASTVERSRADGLFTTPELLSRYVEQCKPSAFGSLELIVTAGATLPEDLSDACEDRFGVRPLEAYGTTECAPVIAVGAPDFRARGFFQPGSRRGYVGRPLPGVAVKIVDPQSFEERPDGETGLILVRGPNVMRGYLGADDDTSAVMRGGWFVTGDLGAVDPDGFLRVSERGRHAGA